MHLCFWWCLKKMPQALHIIIPVWRSLRHSGVVVVPQFSHTFTPGGVPAPSLGPTVVAAAGAPPPPPLPGASGGGSAVLAPPPSSRPEWCCKCCSTAWTPASPAGWLVLVLGARGG